MFEKRIANSVKLLDEKAPKDWRDKIKDLYMPDCTRCILGQIYGDYDTGIDELNFDQKDDHYAFQLSGTEDQTVYWNILQEEWESCLKKKLQQV